MELEIALINSLLLYKWCRQIEHLQASGGLEPEDNSYTDNVSQSSEGQGVSGGEAGGVTGLQARVPVYELEPGSGLPIGGGRKSEPSSEQQ